MMSEISLTGVLVVAAIAFAVPLGLGLFPSLRLPSVVLEIVAGIVIGPQILGLVEVDLPLRVLALIGLAFLLFLAGLEIDLDRLRGRPLRSAATGFALSVAVAFAIASGLGAAGLVRAPLLVAIILSATTLGIVVPVLSDAGRLGTPLGQLVVAAASIADFGTVVLLSLFFSREATSVWSTLLLLGGFVLLAAAVGVAIAEVGHWRRLEPVLRRLQDSSAQIRVRGALLLARGLPALLYRPLVGTRGAVTAGLLQATSLPFIVAAAEIGMKLGELSPATGAALVVAGLLSVVLFPLGALTLLRAGEEPTPAGR